MATQFRDVVKKYAPTDQALGVPGGEVGGIPVPSAEDFATAEQGAKADTAVQPDDLGAAASMSPVEVVTDPDAQAALTGTFATHQDLDDAAIGEYTPEQLLEVVTGPESVAALAASFVPGKKQDAGGVVSTGDNTVVGDVDSNLIASDLGSATVIGGGYPGRENVVGGPLTNVGTSTPNETATGTGADYSAILGGYDNVAGGLMSVIAGAHNATDTDTTHGTISGGSNHRILQGDYHTIGGGTDNTVSASSRGTVAGGSGNTVSGTGAVVGGGQNNTASGGRATVAGGYGNSATAQGATVVGGETNQATGVGATVAGGVENVAVGSYSTVTGLRGKATLWAADTIAGGRIATVGDAQTSVVPLFRSTSAGSQTNITPNGGTQTLALTDNTSWAFEAMVVAREAATGDSGAWKVSGLIKRGVGAATTAIVGTVTETTIAVDAGAATWGVTADADTTNGALRIRITGQASRTIAWSGRLTLAEVTA